MTNVSHIGTLLVFYYFFIAAREFSFQPSEYQEETKATGFEVQVSAIMMDGGPHHVTRPLFCPVLLKITQDPQSTTHNIIYIYIYRERETERARERETERDRDRERQRQRQTERDRDRETGPGNVFSTLYSQANPQLLHRVLKPPYLHINPKVERIEPQQDEMVSLYI